MSHLTVKVSSAARCGAQLELAMNAVELKRLLVSVTRLTSGQKAELLGALNAGGHDEEVRLILESRLVETPACPHCNGACIVHNGSASVSVPRTTSLRR